MRARLDTAPQDMLTRTTNMNSDLKYFIAMVLTRAVLPTLLLVAAVAFVTMPFALGGHPGEAGGTPPLAARHMT